MAKILKPLFFVLLLFFYIVINYNVFAQGVLDSGIDAGQPVNETLEPVDNYEAVQKIDKPTFNIEFEAEPEIKDIFDLKIPSLWGTVKDVYKGDPDKVIVHIQDAHCNYEAQTNILHILDTLVQEYGVSVCGIEGSSGRLQTELFSTFPDAGIREDAADYFIRQGKMSGPEALVIGKGFEYPLELYGIEEQELYKNNFDAFKTSLPFKKDVQVYFRYLNRCIGKLKPYLYNENLSRIDKDRTAFNLKLTSLNKYCIFLEQEMEENDLSSDLYLNFFKLLKSIKLEKQIDFTKAEQERAKLLSELTNVISEENVRELVDQGAAYRDGYLSASKYLTFIKKLAEQNDIEFTPYSNLDSYIEYASGYDSVNTTDLFNEIDEIDAQIREQFYTDDAQRKLDFWARGLRVMGRLVEIKMVNKDLSFYQEHKDELKTDRYREFVSQQADQFGIDIDLPADVDYLDVYVPAWVDFYKVACLRDGAMLSNTLQIMQDNGQKIIAMVTGGFHTRELKRIMRAQGISYLVVTPRITKNVQGPYFDRLEGKKTVLDEIVDKINEEKQKTEKLTELETEIQ
ncbi:MAG: hypothetical protein DRP78_04120 [Candidatus Omnitrophota bacterium]|nr:MAG: hypothetical protein DRP78_04120 [Candidatus Omnitrophota bacterium]